MRSDGDKKRIVLAVLGGVAAGAALLGSILLVEFVWAPPWLVSPWTLGWVAPIASVAIIAGVSWALLSQTGRTRADDDSLYVTCESCGHAVFRDWRLCPYCGVRFDAAARGAREPAQEPQRS